MPDWMMPAFLTAFATLVWYLAKRIMQKQDDLSLTQQRASEEMQAKLDDIQRYLQNELRGFDVRLSVVETLVLPKR